MKPLARDKLLHLGVGVAIMAAQALLLLVAALALGAPMLLALAAVWVANLLPGRLSVDIVAFLKEEWWDRKRGRGHKDGWDAFATSAGGSIGQLLVAVACSVAFGMLVRVQ